MAHRKSNQLFLEGKGEGQRSRSEKPGREGAIDLWILKMTWVSRETAERGPFRYREQHVWQHRGLTARISCPLSYLFSVLLVHQQESEHRWSSVGYEREGAMTFCLAFKNFYWANMCINIKFPILTISKYIVSGINYIQNAVLSSCLSILKILLADHSQQKLCIPLPLSAPGNLFPLSVFMN